MDRVLYLVSHTNPEPWAIGTISNRRMSPNLNLDAYKRSIKEEFDKQELLHPAFRKFTFYFWRQQARYLDMGDKVRQRNQADATNMQKALEDALQGVLFKNDRDTLDIRSVIVAQGPDVVNPGTIIVAQKLYAGFSGDWETHVSQEIPPQYVQQLKTGHQVNLDNEWGEGEDLF